MMSETSGSVPIGFTYLGAFLPPRLYADIVMFTPDACRVLTFDGEVRLDVKHIIDDSSCSAATTECLAEQNRQVTARNKGAPKGSMAAVAPHVHAIHSGPVG